MKLTFYNLTFSIRAHILQKGHLPLRGPPFSVARILRVYFSVRPRTQIKYYHTFFSIQYILEHYTMALIKVDTYYHHGISASIRIRVGTLLWVFSKEGGDIYLHIVRSLSTLSSAHALNVTLRTRSDRITEKEKKAR